MSGIILATTWCLRGDLPQLQRLLPRLRDTYSGIAVALPPDVDADAALELQELLGNAPVIPSDWTHGRHAALQKAVDFSGSHVHYADMDRLLHWVEAWPEEWQQTLAALPQHDCLILGRSQRAWATYPQALQETERSINDIFSELLGQPVDLGSGSRGFSRAAALCLLANSPPGRAPGTDAEWPVLLQRAGFPVAHLAVEGLEWTPPGGLPAGAGADEARQQAAAAYDQDIGHWLRRAALALEIIQAGLDAAKREFAQRADYWRGQV